MHLRISISDYRRNYNRGKLRLHSYVRVRSLTNQRQLSYKRDFTRDNSISQILHIVPYFKLRDTKRLPILFYSTKHTHVSYTLRDETSESIRLSSLLHHIIENVMRIRK